MARKLVWFEAVDLDDCVFDTNDISTIRGGSLAMLDAARLLGDHLWNLPGCHVSVAFTGASQGLFALPEVELARVLGEIESFADGTSPALSGFDPPFPAAALHFVVGVTDLDEDAPVLSMRRAQAAARRAQVGSDRRFGAGAGVAGGLPNASALGWRGRVEVPGVKACPIERRRPADTTMKMPRARAVDLGIREALEAPESQKTVDVPLSWSVKARRRWGIEMRHAFYEREAANWRGKWNDLLGRAGEGRRNFVYDLQEMVEAPPPDVALPPSVKNKIAVLYADGNGFGKILSAAHTLDEVKSFSNDARALMKCLLTAMLERVSTIAADKASYPEGAPIPPEAGAFFEDGEPRLRFENLLYGGDEICWVFPAWIALDLMGELFAALDGASLKGQPATFSCGLVIADRKMPIADLRSLAYDAAALAKIEEESPKTRLTIEIFESIEPPSGGLEAHRARVVGKGEDVKRFLALDRYDLARVLGWIRKRKKDGAPPRSQIVRILADAQRGGIEADEALRRLGSTARPKEGAVIADDRVREAWRYYAERTGAGLDTLKQILCDPTPSIDEKGEVVGRTHAPALDLWLAAQLWDYVDPFARGDVK